MQTPPSTHSLTAASLGRREVAALTALYAIAMKCTLLMPLIVVELMRLHGLGEDEATGLASLEVLGLMTGLLINQIIARWRRHLPPWAGLLMCVAGELLTLVAHTPVGVGVGRVMAGVGAGWLVARIAQALAGQEQAEAWWGRVTAYGGLVMGVLMVVLSMAQAHPESAWLFKGLALFVVLMAPAVLWLPAHVHGSLGTSGEVKGGAPHAVQGSAGWWTALLLATFGIYAAMSGQWAVAGVIGARWGLAPDTIGLYLAISVLGFVGAAVPGFLAGRLSERVVLVAVALVWGASLLWFCNVPGGAHFAAAQTVMSAAFYVGTPYVFGWVSERDPDGTRVSWLVLLILVALMLSTAVSGLLYNWAGPTGFGWATAALGSGSLLLLAMLETRPVSHR